MSEPCTCVGEDLCPACLAYGRRPHTYNPATRHGQRDRADALADALKREAENARKREQKQRDKRTPEALEAKAQWLAERPLRAARSLAQRLGITVEEAQRFLARQAAARPPKGPYAAKIGCPGCGRMVRVTSIPMRTLCCHFGVLQETPS